MSDFFEKEKSGMMLHERIGVTEELATIITDKTFGMFEDGSPIVDIGDALNHWVECYEKEEITIKELAFASYIVGMLTSDPEQAQELFQVYLNRKNFNSTQAN